MAGLRERGATEQRTVASTTPASVAHTDGLQLSGSGLLLFQGAVQLYARQTRAVWHSPVECSPHFSPKYYTLSKHLPIPVQSSGPMVNSFKVYVEKHGGQRTYFRSAGRQPLPNSKLTPDEDDSSSKRRRACRRAISGVGVSASFSRLVLLPASARSTRVSEELVGKSAPIPGNRRWRCGTAYIKGFF